MWVLPKTVSRQMWKHHRSKSLPSRTTMHMHARPASKVSEYFAVSASKVDRRNKGTEREVSVSKIKTNGGEKDL